MKPIKFAPIGVGWGTTNIPENQRIDPSKKYVTVGGKPVVNLTVNLFIDIHGETVEVTYPVKGNVIMGKGKQPEYRIWTLDGQHFLFGKSKWDLIEVKKV